MADYTKMSINDLRTLIADAQRALDEKIEARRSELQAELASLGRATIKQAAKRTTVKPLYRGPDGQEWSGRGAIPTAFKKLGVKDKAGMAQYAIK